MTRTPDSPDAHEVPPPHGQLRRFLRGWRKLGAGSLIFSVALHVGLLIIAGAVIITTQVKHERAVDFLPGGGPDQGAQASEQMAQQVQAKRRSTLTKSLDLKRIVVEHSDGLQLPQAPLELISLPVSSKPSGGAGSGFGDGFGKGAMNGMAFSPLNFFGKEIKARKLGVVMDVSRSMTKHLTRVCIEMDRYAKDSPLVLYFGCGLMPLKDYKVDDDAHRVGAKDFERYWRVWQGNTPINTKPSEWKTVQPSADEPMRLPDIFNVVNKRRDTYYIDYCSINHAWLALMSDRFRFCDAIYWFADFEDRIDDKQAKRLLTMLKDRRQRLYLHASHRGRFFEHARDWICLPSGGEVIEDSKE
jgi:hypothetical protein